MKESYIWRIRDVGMRGKREREREGREREIWVVKEKQICLKAME